MDPVIFDCAASLGRVAVSGLATFVGVVAILRLSGARTLAKLNQFDFVITIALGSIFASTVLSTSVTIAEGLAATIVLVGLQWSITKLSVLSPRFRQIVTTAPELLFYQGAFQERTMQRARVTRDELRSATRDSSIGSMADVAAMVLESDGTISIIPHTKVGDGEVVPPREQE
ncbi:hypothetical protein PB2503_09614 [Parvularcula bermudensis HTCC2503]|uniref:DUF421 domain-containing protein n=1 Tax=Parvularcula bermudensis (strain ATCC BAA-594 / HTCC2503 / KCTC 12087) TaxID=314260 RepID=E0TDQ9_PARBH|nr:YetF domain-containing protein [Parvularcula bermudensis]ADM09975.1 hypothetical protein PB2503_09614 [Parvularcula bermudensis HTCC2503]